MLPKLGCSCRAKFPRRLSPWDKRRGIDLIERVLHDKTPRSRCHTSGLFPPQSCTGRLPPRPTGPVQPVVRDSEMSCILRGTEGCSQADYMDLRYAVTTNTGEEIVQTWEHKLKHYFRFEGKSHHAGEYQNYLEYFADCLESGKTAYPNIKEGVGTVALLQAMDKSLQTGLPVKIADVLATHQLSADILNNHK